MNPPEKFSVTNYSRTDRHGNHEVQMLDLPGSPQFPRRSTSPSPPSMSTTSTPVREGHSPMFIEDGYSTRSETTGSDITTVHSSPGKTSRRNVGADLLNFITRKRTHSSSSSTDGDKSTDTKSSSPSRTSPSPGPINKAVRILMPSKSPISSKKNDVDTKVSTATGHFSVAPKDMSVLERISKRAQHHSKRVRKPHEVFVELEELRLDPSDELEWEETARWIKFEEDVEEGSGRWGRPHVSALAFHSLVELRRGLEKGLVMLDVEGEDFPTIADEIVDTLIASGQLPEKQKEPVLRILLKKHKHSNDITLWEKLKQSAVDPDGRLHHIGEGLRRISHAHGLSELGGGSGSSVSKPDQSRRNSLSDITLKEVNGSKEKELGNSSSSKRKEFQRISSAPLLAESSDGVPSPPSSPPVHGILHIENGSNPRDMHISDKKVMFNIAGGSSEEFFPAVSPGSSGFVSRTGSTDVCNDTGTTESTVLTDTTIDLDYTDSTTDEDESQDFRAPPGPPERQTSNSSLKRKMSVLSLMNKIPDEAESLTVLVGGVKFLRKPVVAFVRLDQSHLLGDLTEVPIPLRFIFLLLGPEEGLCDYHEVGRAMATLMSDSHFHDTAYCAVCKEDFLDAMDKFLDDSIVLPPGDWDQELLLPIMHERNELRRRKQHKVEEVNQRKFSVDPLKHSRKPCGGMWNDVKKLVKRYPSDLKDALHLQPIISIFFLYVAFLAPAIAFGGLMEEITKSQIGETETLLATGLCGIVYGLFAVQPLAVLAFTGPLLLFETVVYRFAVDELSISYIEWRSATALWLMVFLLIASFAEISFLVKYFSRFSEEVFTGIICLFFVFEACVSIYHIYERNPLCGINHPCGEASHMTNTCQPIHEDDNHSNESFHDDHDSMVFMNDSMDDAHAPVLPSGFRICNQPNTFLWSLMLCVFTFFIAFFLRKLRHGKFLGKQGRRLVSDFGMLTAILLMVALSYGLRQLIAVEKLTVPPNYANSNITRGWFIHPFNGAISVGEGFGAIIPAFLLALLIFIESQLTILLVSKPEHNLQKGVGYHFDLLIVALLTGVCGLLGIPWVCGASVRSIQHLQALSVFTTKNPPGEKPKLLFIREQRVTTIVVHVLILLTPLAYPVLALIPISVTLGVFFYLAYASLSGVQLTKRIKLVITPSKHHPNVHYVRKVRTWKMHLYTFIQVVCIACLFGLKNSPAGMLYPVVIVALIPLRWILGKFFFSHDEIEALDSEEDCPEEHDIHGGSGEFEEFEAHVPY